jgi:hypothetical protein
MSVSMDESLNLRIASIFIMFFASMAGVMLPLYYARNADRTDEKSHQKMADSDAFRIVRTFAAGIMLGNYSRLCTLYADEFFLTPPFLLNRCCIYPFTL